MKTQFISNKRNVLKVLKYFSFVILFCLCANPMYAQTGERTVTGVVTSNDGPLLGATVVLKGKAIGVNTDENGAFTFPEKLKENDVLLITYLGYVNEEIIIGADTTFIKPFLEDNAIVIVAALRTENSVHSTSVNKN